MATPRKSDSTSRLLAAVLAGLGGRRRAHGGDSARRAVGASPLAGAEHCHQRLLDGDTDAAYQFLERLDPDTLAQAHAIAFDGQAGPPAARAALRAAWETYRHDRYRGAN